MGEITSNENSLNVQGIARGKPCINHSGFFFCEKQSCFCKECSRLAEMLVCIDQQKVIKGAPVQIKTTYFLAFKIVLPFIPHPNTFYRKYACY